MKKLCRCSLFFLPVVILGIFDIATVSATEFNSSSFSVSDPVIFSSRFSTTSSYQLWGTIGQVGVGTSTATSFTLNSGFLFYPLVTTPVVTATAGDAQVALSWSASSGLLGWVPSGYDVGQGTTSGGPYTYSSVGNVTSSTRTGLTNGTTYYFVIAVKDAFSNRVATSTQVSGTPAASPSPPPPSPSPSPSPSGGGGGGGGGGGLATVQTSVAFSGRAYPKSTITLLKDAQVAATTIAGADAKFQLSLSGLAGGNYIFSLYSEDKNGNRSSLLTFPVSVVAGAATAVSGIFIAPTIAVDKSEVKRGDNIAIFGQSAPHADIVVSVNSEEEFFGKTISDKDGVYAYNFDTSFVDPGTHYTKSKASIGNLETSGFSGSISFKVGTKNVAVVKKNIQVLKGDVNGDGQVNLVDFSIVAYWYHRPSPPVHVDLNNDKKVDLVDFSIMAFYWTG
ncbi:MAG: Di-glucose-binding within endoplasmic reticulum [Parcubacteria group bacterium Greene0416_14]|nr:MAG: Di-glucose-binding within endoplasmic reticulum [Parcubacteria group bacterium Greene0416_14]